MRTALTASLPLFLLLALLLAPPQSLSAVPTASVERPDQVDEIVNPPEEASGVAGQPGATAVSAKRAPAKAAEPDEAAADKASRAPGKRIDNDGYSWSGRSL